MWRRCATLLLFTLLVLALAILIRGSFHPLIHEVVTTQDIIAGDVFFEIVDPPELEYTYRLRPAKDFGTSFSKRLENVAMILTIPSDACTPIRNSQGMIGNVALVERGECSFLTKAINAELAGAVAVIITEFDSKSNEFDYYIEMIHDTTSRESNIPAGFLLGKNGLIIRNTLRKLKRSYALINLPVNLTFTPPAKINHPPWLGCWSWLGVGDGAGPAPLGQLVTLR